jgi:aldehyde dehydrogenase family 7 protein A1
MKDRKGFFVEPTIVAINKSAPILKEELFAPVLYVVKFESLEEGIEINNDVP